MNSNESWLLIIDDVVYKQLRKFPRKAQQKVVAVLEDPFFNPYTGDIEKIRGEKDVWRRRVGAYRIFYEVHQHNRAVHVFWVERRASSTY